jgi:ATP-binding cassette, subfamily B, bacterial
MLKLYNYPFSKQLGSMDCGPACLKMVSQFYNLNIHISTLRDLCNTSRLGTNIGDIIYAAENIGFKASAFKTTVGYLTKTQPFPCIVHWRKNHYVVLYQIRGKSYIVGDPAYGIIKLPEEKFLKNWSENNEKGIVVLLEPDFKKKSINQQKVNNLNIIQQFQQLLKPHLKQIFQLFLIILISSILSLVIPKTIQYMTDKGVTKKDINVVWTMVMFQFILFLGITITNYLKGVIQSKLSTKLSVSIISNFLLKLLNLPISFFDSKNHSDIYQRIDDHSKIETFLSVRLVSFLFSLSILVSYLFQMFCFDKYIVLSFFLFTAFSFLWFFSFMKKLKELDYHRFALAIEERHYLNDLISGMVEVKLNNAQSGRIDRWQILQKKLFDFKLGSLKLSHFQQIGISTSNQLKSLLITFLCAYWVMNDKITFGVMLSIGYIIGQLTIPLQDIFSFFQDYQDARTSFERLHEIQLKTDENDLQKIPIKEEFLQGFRLSDVSFKYPGIQNPMVLKELNLFIPKGKITALVGTSGSGKTTLMKLLLAFYQPSMGNIFIDDINLKSVNTDDLRTQSGVVMQNGYIYNASIADNISMNEVQFDLNRIENSLQIACLDEFVSNLPSKHDTMLGAIGVELSGGQRQRLLIARAVYRNPQIIFFDEATNALDSNNERAIMKNLEFFFKGKTVVVVAHRLSTVKNADQIIVLEKGNIVEIGTHMELTKKKGNYFELVKNQLELGN